MVAHWQWENATAGAVAGFTTVAAMHPLDVVRTRFQVNEGRGLSTSLPTDKNTAHALFTITRIEGLRGLYAGFFPAVIGSTLSWSLYFFFYGRAKQRYARGSRDDDEKLSPALHLASAAEAGALVCLCTNPIWLVKTRLQLQTPLHQTRPYSGLLDAFRTIMKEEGPRALYKGIVPALVLQVSHGAIQFTAYEELRKVIVDFKERRRKSESTADNLLNSADYAALGGSSKVAAVLLTYPFQVIRARLQQRPSTNGMPRYIDSLHVIRETARFEGLRGFYKGLTANLLKNVPASYITFIVYENVLKLLKQQPPTK
ncbi:PREDICTED: folate transporter 1, chloroplastic-like isoform X1 [Brassica oleracea var. oleracea]|uniref:folate transporter 1, chloroplastic-like isoform X1 n=1 Tax=Brassica oleracea var. oleracea TaxID=109376 RepID=UPI0006A6F2CC|nr:PREDICTED: folate transporter 1, chloroplastic-like isoform X1 [Brassica oleracea var. oleracea]